MSSVAITSPSTVDQSHAIVVVTAATVEAAVAIAQAAMEVVRLTRPSNTIRENYSAIVIQTTLRGYLESLENVDNITGIRILYFHNFSRFDAYIITPKDIKKPFLPIRDKNDTLLFPKGKFVGVYLSEELIYAQKLGYKIFMLKGYTFEKKLSLFKNFISEVYESRLKAKKSGDDTISYGYKILMNSFYGRFGINSESTITEICKRKRYDELTQREQIIMGDKLSDDYYIISYIGNAGYVKDYDWKPPKNSAVQIATAITA
ncbi:hypothetical protein GIB67_042715 [Kingdonia uniflora]|uniref:DNA-directed DNA polymerase n=1 Tax=Kingdonia uniflora TaxID=39325 RepID=A0A7J7NDI3_9MAGN|nr:hypothetical protein GIB67_042715 [Kingdonia uniflora]